MATAQPNRRRLVTSNAENTDSQAVDVESDDVDVNVTKAFTLTLDGHQPVYYQPGIQPMPREHAEHWFAKAQGVTVYDRKAKLAELAAKKAAIEAEEAAQKAAADEAAKKAAEAEAQKGGE